MKYSERKELLEEANVMLTEASDKIRMALHMSDMEARGEKILDMIDHYTGSDDDSGSIPNIVRDLEYASTDPCWTRPLASIKHCGRKDI